jgi:ParB-like chromosome segregation protein Spo0J
MAKNKKVSVGTETDLCHIAESLRSLAVPIDSIDMDPANARKHPTENIEAIRASLRVYGQRKPIVVNRRTRTVEAGNGTLAAGRMLGWKYIAAVFVDDDSMTAAEFAIADNRTAELAEWDQAALEATLRSLVVDDAELKKMLDDMAEDVLVPAPVEIIEDEVPEPPAVPVTKPGDLWILGQTVTCPKCKKKTDV